MAPREDEGKKKDGYVYDDGRNSDVSALVKAHALSRVVGSSRSRYGGVMTEHTEVRRKLFISLSSSPESTALGLHTSALIWKRHGEPDIPCVGSWYAQSSKGKSSGSLSGFPFWAMSGSFQCCERSTDPIDHSALGKVARSP